VCRFKLLKLFFSKKELDNKPLYHEEDPKVELKLKNIYTGFLFQAYVQEYTKTYWRFELPQGMPLCKQKTNDLDACIYF